MKFSGRNNAEGTPAKKKDKRDDHQDQANENQRDTDRRADNSQCQDSTQST